MNMKKEIISDFIPFMNELIQDLTEILPNKEEFKLNIIKYKNNIKNKINNYLITPLIQDKIVNILKKNNLEQNKINISYMHELIWDKLIYYKDIKLSQPIYNLSNGQLNIDVILIKEQPHYYISFQANNLIILWKQILENNKIVNKVAPMDYIVAHILGIDITLYCDILKNNNGIRKHNQRKTDLKGFNLESSYLFKDLKEIKNIFSELEPYIVLTKLSQN